MTAEEPRPANSQVWRARCMGLQRTSANTSLASAGRSRSARRRPLSVSGMSVVPVCCPLRLHAVSPCRIAKTFIFALAGSNVVGLGRADTCRNRLLPPFPARNLGHVVAVAFDIRLVIDEPVPDRLLSVSSPGSELRYAINHVADEMEAIEAVQYAHVERCRGGALFPVAAHVEVAMTLSPVGQPVNEPRIAVEGEDDRLVGREQRIEIVIRQAVRMLARRLQGHQVYDIDDADLHLGRMPTQQVHGGQRLQ